MQNEPTEFSLMNGASRTRLQMRRAERARPVIQSAPADALDAAFDEYSRIDAVPQQAAPREARAMTKDLIADIAAQLHVLDRQREQLAALLRDSCV